MPLPGLPAVAAIGSATGGTAAADPPPRADQTAPSEPVEDNLLLKVIEAGDLTPLQARIPEVDARRLSQSQLRVLRNTIFAQYGYRFYSPDLQAHFGRFSWYRPDPDLDIRAKLTNLDEENIALLKSLEH